MNIINMAPGLSFPPPYQHHIKDLKPGLFLSQGKWSDDGLVVNSTKLAAELSGVDPDTFIMLNVEVAEQFWPESKRLDISRYPAESTLHRWNLSLAINSHLFEHTFYQTLRTVVRVYNKTKDPDRQMEGFHALSEALAVQDWIGDGLPCVSAYWHDDPEIVPDWAWNRWTRTTGKEIADCRYYAKRDPVVVFAHRQSGDKDKPHLSEALMERQFQWFQQQGVTLIFWAFPQDTDYQSWLPGKLWWYAQ